MPKYEGRIPGDRVSPVFHKASDWLTDIPNFQGEILSKHIWPQNHFFFFFEYSLGRVFCTTQFEYFEKFLYFWPNRQTGWKQSSNGGNQQRHIWEWALLEPKSEVLERRPRLFHVYQASCLTDGMEVVRLRNKPVAWGQGRKRVPLKWSLQQWLFRVNLLKESTHQRFCRVSDGHLSY